MIRRLSYQIGRIGFAAISCLAFLTIFLATQGTARAQTPTEPPPAPEAQGETSSQPGVSNDYCFSCHAAPDLQTTLPSGEVLNLTVDPEVFKNTVHGLQGYACVQCHTDIREYPHPPLNAETRRDVTLLYYQSCARCHQAMYEKTLDSVHQKALQEGNQNAAVCTDCHGAHNVVPPDEPRTRIPATCRNCHSTIYETYTDSVHGEALLGEGNPDVPTCVDCHGVHNVSGPSNRPFHLFSPQICARCHADEELMAKYGISTNVFDSYVADFHGTTVIFDQSFPDQEVNAPVCIDCHGVHDMQRVDEQESQVMKENLLDTCRKCHPDASANFTDAWLSHYQPDRTHYPAVYYTNIFYRFFIPAVLGGMAIFVVGDASRRILNRRKKQNHE